MDYLGMSVMESIEERDIDLLLLEEFLANVDFLESFVREVFPESPEGWTLEGAWHSVCCAGLGETDLLLVITGAESFAHALMVENKIDANQQPDQAGRYRERGYLGIKNGKWNSFTTCIVAPQEYLDATPEVLDYDRSLSYETLSEMLDRSFEKLGITPERSIFRLSLLTKAIKKCRRGYEKIKDEIVTSFWRDYWNASRLKYPEIEMEEPSTEPGEGNWINLYPSVLPKGYQAIHKLKEGYVDLQLPVKYENILICMDACRDLLDEDMRVVRTKGSCSIRVIVPQIDPTLSFESQENKAYQGMKVVPRLARVSALLPQKFLEFGVPCKKTTK